MESLNITYSELIQFDIKKWDGKPFIGIFWDDESNNNIVSKSDLRVLLNKRKKFIKNYKFLYNAWIDEYGFPWQHAAIPADNNKIIKILMIQQRLSNMEKDFE